MTPRFLSLIWIVTVAGLLIFGTGCSLFSPEDDDSSYFFIAEVTIFEAPESISYGDSLSIQIGGYLGSDSCYKLDRIEMIRRPNRLGITVHGLYDHGDHGICLTVGSTFYEQILVAAPITTSDQHDFTITIHQPDGSTLEHTVTVEESQN